MEIIQLFNVVDPNQISSDVSMCVCSYIVEMCFLKRNLNILRSKVIWFQCFNVDIF
jgi:hypothetical protein